MTRVYPPIWCSEDECTQCDFISCDQKIIHLFNPYYYPNIDFTERPKDISWSTIGVYFGYCKRLANFFLRYSQIGPISVVENNFYCFKDNLPAEVEIPRILLDMLTHGIDVAPTDEVHKLKLMLGMREFKTTQARLGIAEEEKEITMSQDDIDAFYIKATDWQRKILKNIPVSFEMTADLNKCKYCFLQSCDIESER